MALNTSPFHPVTGELLPAHRDAYLRGDLSSKNTDLVDAYFKANPEQGVAAFQRFHVLEGKGHQVRPVGWLQHQFTLIRTEPARFRRRAGGLLAVAALISGAVFASSGPAVQSKTASIGDVVASAPTTVALAPAATTEMTTVSGRILDENGHPLIGATVLDKRNGRGVSTDAQGNYSLAVPRNQSAQLQFGYGGYQEEEILVKGSNMQNITLLPRTDRPKKHRWWPF